MIKFLVTAELDDDNVGDAQHRLDRFRATSRHYETSGMTLYRTDVAHLTEGGQPVLDAHGRRVVALGYDTEPYCLPGPTPPRAAEAEVGRYVVLHFTDHAERRQRHLVVDRLAAGGADTLVADCGTAEAAERVRAALNVLAAQKRSERAADQG